MEEQSLLEMENENLKKALKAVSNTLERLKDDNNNLKQLHIDQKKFQEDLLGQRDEQMEKLKRLELEKQELKNILQMSQQDNQNEIMRYKIDIEELESRLLQVPDISLLRAQFEQEFQMIHKSELDKKDMEIDSLKDDCHSLRRNLEQYKGKYEQLQLDFQSDLRVLQQRHQTEMKDMLIEVQISEENQKVLTRERENHRRTLLECDELQNRIQLKDEIIDRLRHEIDDLKDGKQRQLEKIHRELEEERYQKGKVQSDLDKSQIIVKNLEEQLKKATTSYSNLESKLAFNQQGSPVKNKAEYSVLYEHLNDMDLVKMNEREKNNRILNERVRDLQRQINDERENHKKDVRRLEEQVDRLRMDKKELDEELRRTRLESSAQLNEERKKYQKLSSEFSQLQNQQIQIDQKNRSVVVNQDRKSSVDNQEVKQSKGFFHFGSVSFKGENLPNSNSVVVANPQTQQNADVQTSKLFNPELQKLQDKYERTKQKLREANLKIKLLMQAKEKLEVQQIQKHFESKDDRVGLYTQGYIQPSSDKHFSSTSELKYHKLLDERRNRLLGLREAINGAERQYDENQMVSLNEQATLTRPLYYQQTFY